MFGIESLAAPRDLPCSLFLGRLEWKVMGSVKIIYFQVSNLLALFYEEIFALRRLVQETTPICIFPTYCSK
jgi:hypothetical protein